MNPAFVGAIGIGILILLLFLEVHVGIAMGLVGIVGFAYLAGVQEGFHMLGMLTYPTISSYDFLVLPLFICMGLLASHSGMAKELYGTAYKWIGSQNGGLAVATIAACGGFAAVSGTSVGTALTIGPIALPEMKKYHYADSLATGSVAAGGTLGILIPPSTTLVLYGIITENSAGALLIAGIIPGILLVALFILSIYIQTKINPSLGPAGEKTSFKVKFLSLRGTLATLLLFFLVMGGLWVGAFTATEAGGIGAFGAVVIGLAKRTLGWNTLREAMVETLKTTGMLMFILLGAYMLNAFLSVSQLPSAFSNFLVSLNMSRYMIFALVVLMYIVLGCLMESFSTLILTMPIIYPLMMSLGFDPIWFGVIMVIMMEQALITPPIGLNVFVIRGLDKSIPIRKIYSGIFPFWVSIMVLVVLLAIFPQIALFLGSLK